MKRHNKDLKCYKNSVTQVDSCEIFRLITNLVQHGMHLAHSHSVTRISIKKIYDIQRQMLNPCNSKKAL